MKLVDAALIPVIVLGAAAVPAAAAPQAGSTGAPALSLSLDDAIARALATAPRIAEARSRAEAAASAVSARTALGRPGVTVTSGALRTNHVDEFGLPQPDGSLRVIFPDLPANYQARAELTVPVFTSGRVSALVDAASADSRAADADRRTTAADVRLDVTTAYWTLVTAREQVTVLRRALARADASLADVRARVETGVLPPNDAQSAQAQRARQQVQLIQAENQAALAGARLARLIGEPLDREIVPATPATQPMAAAEALAALPVDALVARARDGRPERLALTEREAGLRATAEAALAAARPQVAALAAVEPARPNPRFVPRVDDWKTSWDLGVNVTWPLWDGGRARADHATATAQADAVRHRVDDLDQGLALEIRQRLLDLASARAAIAASTDAVQAATEAHRVVGERFAVGVATSTDVLEAEVALLEAELERTRLVTALRLDEARLVRTVGGEP